MSTNRGHLRGRVSQYRGRQYPPGDVDLTPATMSAPGIDYWMGNPMPKINLPPNTAAVRFLQILLNHASTHRAISGIGVRVFWRDIQSTPVLRDTLTQTQYQALEGLVAILMWFTDSAAQPGGTGLWEEFQALLLAAAQTSHDLPVNPPDEHLLMPMCLWAEDRIPDALRLPGLLNLDTLQMLISEQPGDGEGDLEGRGTAGSGAVEPDMADST
ncbi:hypothetical protein C8T65DRAFT_738556 [Cerioporus squamosus]|nr:hypothetical protein C8T65DRAFT_738556 [Cerioporus squamosus]